MHETVALSTGSTCDKFSRCDRLNRHEFERRYNAMLSLKKAELIEGYVSLAVDEDNVIGS